VNLLWVRIRDAIAGALDSMTLADLVPLRAAPIALKSATLRTTTEATGALTAS